MDGMKRLGIGLALIIACTLSVPASAELITRGITGTIFESTDSGAEVGLGTVDGFVEYDDLSGFTGFLDETIFPTTDFALIFSNGPTIVQRDAGPVFVGVSDDGNLVDFFIFNSPFEILLGGFSSNQPLYLDIAFTEILFADSENRYFVEGSLAFVSNNDVPAPATLALFVLGGLCLLRRRSAPHPSCHLADKRQALVSLA